MTVTLMNCLMGTAGGRVDILHLIL